MSVGVYLNYNGNCREALAFYENAFKTPSPTIMTYGDAPGGAAGIPEALKPLVLHSQLKLAGAELMLSDVPPDAPVTVGNNVSVMVELKTADQVRAVFHALKSGGTVITEPQETFFNGCYASVCDPFGVTWQLILDSLKD